MYGKLINNNLTLAPRRMTIDGCVVFNPTDAQYEAAGYLPVIYTPAPEAPEGYYADAHWEEHDSKIVEIWEFVPYPEPIADNNTPAWDISQGEYIPVGFLLNRDGVTYECIAGHYAAWNKQPPNETYWKEAL